MSAALERGWRHAALAALAAGLALSEAPPALVAAAGALAAGALTAMGAPRVAAACLACLLAGLALGDARLGAIDAPGKRLRPGERIAGRAHLLSPPRAGPFGTTAEIRFASPGRARGARLAARFPPDAQPPRAAPGAELVVTGTVRLPPRRSRSGFDVRAFRRRRGIAAELNVSTVRATGRRRGGVAGLIDAARRRAERGLASGLSPPEAALVHGMVLGQDERIDPPTLADFRDSGLGHLLAVSGQNVMLLAALALPLFAAAGLPWSARIAGTIALIALYVPLAGAGPSLQRAGVMGAAGLVALLASRPASRWYALGLAACVTLALNPRATGDPGWQLSFAAVAGILLLGPPIRDRLTALPRLLAEGIAVTAAATIATVPLLAHYFGSVPATGLAANLAALPLVAPIMWLGMVRAALGQAAALGGPVEAVNAAAGMVLGPLARALASVAQAFAEAPGAGIGLPLGSRTGVLLAYVGLAVVLLASRGLLRRLDPEPSRAWWRRRPLATRRAATAMAGIVAAAAIAVVLGSPRPPQALTVSFLDVGQGDATLIQHPDGSAVLFDTGPPEGRVARALRRAGVRRLSALVVTHAERDHEGAASDVIRRFPVDVVLDGGDGSTDEDYRAALRQARARGARRIEAVAPARVQVGAIAITVLAPQRRPPGPAPDDPNQRAVVALVSVQGFDLLLTADAESPSLLPLALPQVDAMKVPHHGSSDPGLAELLSRLRPRIAAIEVGANPYGHPAPATLAALRAAGIRTFRTDRFGTIRLRPAGGEVAIETER